MGRRGRAGPRACARDAGHGSLPGAPSPSEGGRPANPCPVPQAAATFVALVTKQRAPYGRYFEEGRAYGFLVPGKAAWIAQVRGRNLARTRGVPGNPPRGPCYCVQECPTLLFAFGSAALCWWHGPCEALAHTPNQILLALFALHYVHRTLIFPLRIVGGKPTPVVIMLMAMAFCVWNGYGLGPRLAAWRLNAERPWLGTSSPRG